MRFSSLYNGKALPLAFLPWFGIEAIQGKVVLLGKIGDSSYSPDAAKALFAARGKRCPSHTGTTSAGGIPQGTGPLPPDRCNATSLAPDCVRNDAPLLYPGITISLIVILKSSLQDVHVGPSVRGSYPFREKSIRKPDLAERYIILTPLP